MNKLVFYTTAGCHLCEQAAVLLRELTEQTQTSLSIEIEEVDIATDAKLVELYGIRIPVVKNANTQREVGWPFDLEELAKLF